jgi:hypothetical protein
MPHSFHTTCLGLLVLALPLATGAKAAPPPGADPSQSPWFQNLRRPGSGFPCCSEADCRNVDTRAVGGRLEVFIDRNTFGSRAPDGWVAVPPANVLAGSGNPTGGPVACWTAWGGVLCFVPGAGT